MFRASSQRPTKETKVQDQDPTQEQVGKSLHQTFVEVVWLVHGILRRIRCSIKKMNLRSCVLVWVGSLENGAIGVVACLSWGIPSMAEFGNLFNKKKPR